MQSTGDEGPRWNRPWLMVAGAAVLLAVLLLSVASYLGLPGPELLEKYVPVAHSPLHYLFYSGDLEGRSTSPDDKWIVSVYWMQNDSNCTDAWYLVTAEPLGKSGSADAARIYDTDALKNSHDGLEFVWDDSTTVRIGGYPVRLRR